MASNKTEIEIDGKNTGAILSINGVKQELKGLGDYVGGQFGSAINTLNKHLAFAGVAAGIGALAALTKQAINSADELYKMSQRIGVSVESLSTLKYAADLSDLSMEQLQASLKKLSVNLYDVAHGQGKDAAAAFNELGLNLTDASGKGKLTEDVLLDVAEKFSVMGDGAEKSAIAVKLFGKSGLDMIPFLNQGKDGIKALTNEAEKLGLKMTTEFAQKAEAFNDSLTTMNYMTKGVGVTIAQQLMPTLFSLSGSLTTLATDSDLATTSGGALAIVLKSIATILGGVYAGAYTAGAALGTFGAAAATLISTGSFEQAGHVFELGWANIEKASKSFGNSFNTLWSDNTAELDAFMKKVHQLTDGGNGQTPADKVKKLFDAFGHPIDENGMLRNVPKYLEAMMKNNPAPGFDTTSLIANMPTYDMSQFFIVQSDPFENIKTDAEAFFDYYSSRGAEMREQTSEMFGNMSSAASAFYQMSGQKSKEWFAVQKGFNIAQAVMNTYEGATKALAQGGFFGIAMAATVIAAGLAQVAMIASQQPNASGGGGARSVSSGGSALSQPSNLSNATGNYNPGQNVNYTIIVQGNIVDQNRFARELVPAINRAVSDGVS